MTCHTGFGMKNNLPHEMQREIICLTEFQMPGYSAQLLRPTAFDLLEQFASAFILTRAGYAISAFVLAGPLPSQERKM